MGVTVMDRVGGWGDYCVSLLYAPILHTLKGVQKEIHLLVVNPGGLESLNFCLKYRSSLRLVRLMVTYFFFFSLFIGFVFTYCFYVLLGFMEYRTRFRPITNVPKSSYMLTTRLPKSHEGYAARLVSLLPCTII